MKRARDDSDEEPIADSVEDSKDDIKKLWDEIEAELRCSDDDSPKISKRKKTPEEQLAEIIKLCQEYKPAFSFNLSDDVKLNMDMHENIKTTEDSPEESSFDIRPNKGYKIFCAENNLGYFSSENVTLQFCGYDESDESLTSWERMLLSFDSNDVLKSLSSILINFNLEYISDHRENAFFLYLLQTLAFNESLACLISCEATSLKLHEGTTTNFEITSLDVCKLLFNFGVNVEECHLFNSVPHLKSQLIKPPLKPCKVPSTWLSNMQSLFKILSRVITYNIEDKDMEDVLKILLIISLDKSLMFHIISLGLKDCIRACLVAFDEDTLENIPSSLVRFILSLNITNEEIVILLRAFPETLKRGVFIQKEISFGILKHLLEYGCKRQNNLPDDIRNMNKGNLNNLVTLIEYAFQNRANKLDEMAPFIDYCVGSQPLFDSKEHAKSFCDILRRCASLFGIEKKCKTDFVRIFTRLTLQLDL